ncbi:hypothetical protein [Thermofilum sp.]|jgi:hypothetical protein|uniref:hypothetical protein n=1 Tax=Thermofilum sp. TaxID=1961369 RepID=UPI00258B5615|nr:hypothetical protein [Thermofilum sp.]
MSGNGAGKGDAGAGQGFWEDLEARLKELEKYLNGEFYERIKDFWYEALKYYVGNVLDISELEKEFGELQGSVVGVRISLRSCNTSIISGTALKMSLLRGFGRSAGLILCL